MPHTPTNQITPDLAGCWVDGHHGHYASLQVISIAVLRGFTMNDEAARIVQRYPDHGHEGMYPHDQFVGIADDAEEFLQTLAPTGYFFEWVDGEFFLSPDEEEIEEQQEQSHLTRMTSDYLGPATTMGQDI